MSFSKMSGLLDESKDGLLKNDIEHYVESGLVLKEAGDFRVATYNILSSRLYDPKGRSFNPQKDHKLSWAFRKNLIAEAIRSLNIDILALQEVRSDQLNFLAEELTDFGSAGFSEHSGKSLDEIREEKLSDDDVRELVPIFYRKDLFAHIESQRWFLSDTPEKVSSASGASRPRIVIAAAFTYLPDNTTIVVSNTHYDHLHTTEGLKQEGHRECLFLEEFCARHNATDAIYMGDRNSFVDKTCNGDEWYAKFKQESHSEDVRVLAEHIGSSNTFIGYDPDSFKADYNKESKHFDPRVLSNIFYKGMGKVTKSLNSLVEYEFVPSSESEKSVESSSTASTVPSTVPRLCSFFGSPKNPLERQFASDHACVMADIHHTAKLTT